VDPRVEEGAARAHLEFEVVDRVRLPGGEEDLDRLLLPEGIVSLREGPPGVAVDAIEPHVERGFLPEHADQGRLLGGRPVLGPDEGRQRRNLLPGLTA